MGKKRKTPFGRNIFTLVFIALVVFVIGFVTYTITSYASVGSEGDVTPFVTDSSLDEEVQKKLIRVEAKNFDKFNIKFVCTDYNTESHSATFKVSIWKNENTCNVTSNLSGKVCMASDWVGFCKYSSNISLIMVDDEASAKEKTCTISSIISYPAKANTFPIPVTVSKPDVYLYVNYVGTSNGEPVNDHYVIHYAYGEFEVQSGGLAA